MYYFKGVAQHKEKQKKKLDSHRWGLVALKVRIVGGGVDPTKNWQTQDPSKFMYLPIPRQTELGRKRSTFLSLLKTLIFDLKIINLKVENKDRQGAYVS